MFIGGRDAFSGGASSLAVKGGRVDLPDLIFTPADFAGPRQTAAVHVCDAESATAALRGAGVRNNSQAAAAAACSKAYRYGTFYVRQVRASRGGISLPEHVLGPYNVPVYVPRPLNE